MRHHLFPDAGQQGWGLLQIVMDLRSVDNSILSASFYIAGDLSSVSLTLGNEENDGSWANTDAVLNHRLVCPPC